MDGKRLIEKIKLRNILSFGDKGEEITLEPLNIIIGQNASGKSNLVDVIKLLRSVSKENGLADFISRNGGIAEWIWKGAKLENSAQITCELFNNTTYSLAFQDFLGHVKITQEKMLFEDDDFVERENLISKLEKKKAFAQRIFYE